MSPHRSSPALPDGNGGEQKGETRSSTETFLLLLSESPTLEELHECRVMAPAVFSLRNLPNRSEFPAPASP
jgi:hypothetical protein